MVGRGDGIEEYEYYRTLVRIEEVEVVEGEGTMQCRL